ncbi:hypothetical protein AGMMS4952_25160 [Spirochaetia bacterium]|nr:hypothetical protein AGMMS4952_25160 [Spirochaetia bacterium]
MKKLRFFGLSACVLALGLTLTGCGDSGSGDPSSPSGGDGKTGC